MITLIFRNRKRNSRFTQNLQKIESSNGKINESTKQSVVQSDYSNTSALSGPNYGFSTMTRSIYEDINCGINESFSKPGLKLDQNNNSEDSIIDGFYSPSKMKTFSYV
ncbi:hypothetical protein BpHYR1_028995 [Brachionus plicatilis]|uniref:Uncharacterized protein n=1 Tax=Brachionus plicatilis TaxID=10195 RepID=A0A3M7P653_BRAPC|nr:hypothetical protein BpHYR1_028995 [Brachionus plicatilis]